MIDLQSLPAEKRLEAVYGMVQPSKAWEVYPDHGVDLDTAYQAVEDYCKYLDELGYPSATVQANRVHNRGLLTHLISGAA